MIDIKLIKKPKSNIASTTGGIATNGNGYITGNFVKEALHAAKADLAAYAETARRANEADYAKEASHAQSAYDLDADSPVRDQFLSRICDDIAEGKITFAQGLISLGLAVFKDGAHFGEFIRDLYAGKGGGIDKDGNAEFESLRVRTYMEIVELIVNRLSAIEGDQILTESDTIEEVIPHADGVTFTIKVHPKWEGYFTAMIENNVCKGIFNNITDNLTPGVGQTKINNAIYYTAWFRVQTVNAAANTMDVVMYADDEVPAGKNFPPCEMMKFARWGNSGSADEAHFAMRQNCLFLSSTDGRIMKYTNVTKPIIDSGNIAFCTGTLPEAIADLDPRTQNDPEGGYFKTLLVESLITVDHLGRPKPTIRFRGSFSADEDYYDGTKWRSETNDYEQSVVEYYGCQWLCNKSDTHNPPSWKSTDWTFYLGDPTFRIDLKGGPAAVNPRKFRFVLDVVGEKGGQDVTADILPQDVVWTRYTEDSGGVERVASDAIWATRRGGSGKSIEITQDDLDAGTGLPEVCIFTATVTLRDGTELNAEYGL